MSVQGEVEVYPLWQYVYGFAIMGVFLLPRRAKTRGAALSGWATYLLLWVVSGYITRTNPEAEITPPVVPIWLFWCGLVAIVAGFIIAIRKPRKRNTTVA